jgi:hypothetical protein
MTWHLDLKQRYKYSRLSPLTRLTRSQTVLALKVKAQHRPSIQIYTQAIYNMVSYAIRISGVQLIISPPETQVSNQDTTTIHLTVSSQRH